ncbi:MAG: histidine phosphatase family protein [Simkaniaceae bacterium]|nr:histidine phosphatase family protein [Simkaniaceae bacterium]
MANPELYLVRHGETEWSLNGKHTGRTDLPLTENGLLEAERIRDRLKGKTFDHIFSSPLQRAYKTCEIAGLAEKATIDDTLLEWDYGAYEGITTPEIHKVDPSWNVFDCGAPDGESVEAITKRIDARIAELKNLEGTVILFAHGHFLRAFAARWLGLPVPQGGIFLLDTATLSHLSWYRGKPVIKCWNS